MIVYEVWDTWQEDYDTIVALPTAPLFLERETAQILANDGNAVERRDYDAKINMYKEKARRDRENWELSLAAFNEPHREKMEQLFGWKEPKPATFEPFHPRFIVIERRVI